METNHAKLIAAGDTFENKIFRELCLLLRLKSIVTHDGHIADLLCEGGLDCSRKDVERWRTRPDKNPSGNVFKCDIAAASNGYVTINRGIE